MDSNARSLWDKLWRAHRVSEHEKGADPYVAKAIERNLEIKGGMKILEPGCGSGKLL